jgi:hypothetical protein
LPIEIVGLALTRCPHHGGAMTESLSDGRFFEAAIGMVPNFASALVSIR